MAYAHLKICPKEWDTQTPLGIWDTNGSPNLSQTTRSYNNQQKNKRTYKIVDFAVMADHGVKLKESEKRDKYLALAREQKKKHESEDNTNCNWCSWYSHQRISTRNEKLGNKRTSGDHPNYYIIENSQNTEKSPGDLRRLVVTQTPVRNHQLTLLWKTLKREQMMIMIIQLLWDFDIQTDYLISVRGPDLIIIKKKKKKENLQNCRLGCPDWPQNKIERMWKEGKVPWPC